MWSRQLFRHALLVAGVAALALSATGADAADNTVHIGLAVPNQSFYTAVFVAHERGYDKEAGINLDITEYHGGSAAQEALSAGAADIITFFPGGAALAINKGAKEKIVGAITPASSGWYMFVNADSPYHSVADLAGKKVGISAKGSSTDLFALWSAEKAHVSILTIPVGGGGLIPSLKNHQVDAVVVFAPLSLQLMAGGARPLVDYAKEMPPTLLEAWVASQDMIDKRPQQIRAALGAFYKAVDYMQKHHDAAIAYLKKYTQQDDPKVLELAYKVTTMQESINGEFKRQWVIDSLAQSGKGWGVPAVEHMDPDRVYTDKFIPFSFK